MSILVLGAAGQVGRSFLEHAPADARCLPMAHAELDIRDADAVMRCLEDQRPRWVVNCAAYTAVDQAEVEPEAAWAVNAEAVGHLASAAGRTGARLLHLSTDFVFDGGQREPYRPESPTHPLSQYGASKRRGEELALGCSGGIVVRTSWVYAARGRNFVLTMLRLMAERDEVRVVNDQFGSPTWARGLAPVLWRLIASDARAGLYHWCDEGVTSWYDFAVAIQEAAIAAGILARRARVLPIRTGEYPAKAVRPAYSALDCRGTREATGLVPAHWRSNLEEMLNGLRAR